MKKTEAVPNARNLRYRYRDDGSLLGCEVRYRDPEGNLRGKMIPSRDGNKQRAVEAAKRWQTDNAQSINHGKYISPEKERTCWRTVADAWLDSRRVNLRARTIEGYQGILNRWLNRWDKRAISTITREDVRKLLKDLRTTRGRNGRAGLSEETEHRIFNVVSAVFKFAVSEGYVQTNPVDAVRGGKELRSISQKTFKAKALTVAEANRVIACLPPGRYHLFGLLGLWTGFRAGELAGLRVRNLDTLRNTVQADETIEDLGGELRPGLPKTKKSRGRKVPVPKDVMGQVVAFINAKRLGPDDYMFAYQGEYFRYQNFYRRQWKAACADAGVLGVRFHDLRHTFASLRAQQDVPPHVLMDWMGHTNITTTMNIYAHVYEDDPTHLELIERLYASDDGTSMATVPIEVRPTYGSKGL